MWPNLQFPVTFSKEIFNGKLQVLCSAWEIFSFKYNVESKAESLVPDLPLFLKKTLYQLKPSDFALVPIYFNIPRVRYTIKTNCVKR